MSIEKMREEFEVWHSRKVTSKVMSGEIKGAFELELAKEQMFEIWKASRAALKIDFSPCNVQHSSYNNVDCYAISDVAVILKRAGLEMKP